jgi:dTDP-4-amino-4,6-dideoxygalactose transaminase
MVTTSRQCERNPDSVMRFFSAAAGIGANVHYRPIPAHSYYGRSFPLVSTPMANELFELPLTLPLYPGLSERRQSFSQRINHALG